MRHKISADLKYPQLWNGTILAYAPLLEMTGVTLFDNSVFRLHGTGTSIDPSSNWKVLGNTRTFKFDNAAKYFQSGQSLAGLSKVSVVSWFMPTSGTSKMDVVTQGTNSTTRAVFSGSAEDGNSYIIPSLARYGWTDITFAGFTKLICVVSLYDGTESTDAGKLKIIINGSERTLSFFGAGPIASTVPSYTGKIETGRRYPGDAVNFSDGHLAETRIYNRILSRPEIALMSLRPGIAYETIHRRSYKAAAVAGNRRRRLLIGS